MIHFFMVSSKAGLLYLVNYGEYTSSSDWLSSSFHDIEQTICALNIVLFQPDEKCRRGGIKGYCPDLQ